MKVNMSLGADLRQWVGSAIVIGLTCGFITKSCAQTASVESKPTKRGKTGAISTSLKLYEDSYFSIQIPSDWNVSRVDRPIALLAGDHPGVAQFPDPGDGLLLTKNGYTLSLNNHAGQTSPIPGGRFFEVFAIPWLKDKDVSYAWGCGGYLLEEPEPTGEGLPYFNLIFSSLDSEGRKTCGIPKDIVIERRWFAGYFTTAKGMWLFDSESTDCAGKAYTLTSPARTPSELPLLDDPGLKRVIHEAIGIVNSIRYKRCPPAKEPTPEVWASASEGKPQGCNFPPQRA